MTALLPGQPATDGEVVFREPWEAHAFAMTVRLHEQDVFTWPQWVATLAEEIDRAQTASDPDTGETYYHHWLAALERLVAEQGRRRSMNRSARGKPGVEPQTALHTADRSNCCRVTSPTQADMALLQESGGSTMVAVGLPWTSRRRHPHDPTNRLPSRSRVGHDGGVSGVRDYLSWHELYDDPGSSLPRRLALVRDVLRAELDARPGPVRVVSLCAGDGRDILGVLADREDAARVSVTLVEVLPELVERARSAATDVAAKVEVVSADAGCSATYTALATVPADVVLLVGVLGNVSEADVAATVADMPRLCAPGGTLVWSRGRSLEGAEDFVTPVREAFSDAGFAEVSIGSFDMKDDRTALGVVRYDGPPAPFEPTTTWFTFVG